MDTRLHADALTEIEHTFGERYRPAAPGAPTAVAPTNAEEVATLAEIAGRHKLPLAPRGAGTAPGEAPRGLSVGFDLMRRVSLPEGHDVVEIEPGIPWVELEDHLRGSGKSLRVYPTSAPHSTVGGWLARDGLGVGSHEFGWLRDNVESVEIVLPGGERRTLRDEDLTLAVGAEGTTGIIVRATLLLRDAARDTPFAAVFGDAASLVRPIEDLRRLSPPTWHLGFSTPSLALSDAPAGSYILFGTLPAGSDSPDESVEEITARGGEVLTRAEAYRVWGARFFPAGAPDAPHSFATALVPLSGLSDALRRLESAASQVAVQGTVARDGRVLLLGFGGDGSGAPQDLDADGSEVVARAARESGGGEYATGLRRLEGVPEKEALRRFKKEADPDSILGATS